MKSQGNDLEKQRERADQRWFLATQEQLDEFNRLADTPLESTTQLEALAASSSPFVSMPADQAVIETDYWFGQRASGYANTPESNSKDDA